MSWCYGCEYYEGESMGSNSLEGYEEPTPAMCNHPTLLEAADEGEATAAILMAIFFWISEHGHCPFRVNKRPPSLKDIAAKKSAYRAR